MPRARKTIPAPEAPQANETQQAPEPPKIFRVNILLAHPGTQEIHHLQPGDQLPQWAKGLVADAHLVDAEVLEQVEPVQPTVTSEEASVEPAPAPQQPAVEAPVEVAPVVAEPAAEFDTE